MSRIVRISDIINNCNLDLCVPTYINEPLSSILKKICDHIEEGGSGGCCYTFVNSPTVTFVTDGNIISASAVSGIIEFDSGNLAPLFTTSVATATTSPFLSFNLNQQPANKVFAGPPSGANDYPSFRSLVFADMPFDVNDWIQNQFNLPQAAANFWIDGHGRIDDYLQIEDAGRLVKDATGFLSVTSATDSTTGADLRVKHLRFFDDTVPNIPAGSSSQIFSSQGDSLNLHAGTFMVLDTPTVSIGNGITTPVLSAGGYHPLHIGGSDNSPGVVDYLDLWNRNEAGLSDEAKYVRLTFSANRENGSPIVDPTNAGDRQRFGRIGIDVIDWSETAYQGDLVFDTVDAAVNTGLPTEQLRIKYDGRIIAQRYSTLLTAPVTNGVTKMAVFDEDGLLSLENIPAGASGSVTSVGLSMPSAFSVTNSPITSSGTLVVTGAGTSGQYIRGDGVLATFPFPVAISSLAAAANANTINNSNHKQTWNWNSLTIGPALAIRADSGVGVNDQVVFKVESLGAHDKSASAISAVISKTTVTGPAVSTAIYAEASSLQGSNVAIRASAYDNGSGGYAIETVNGKVRLGDVSNDSGQDRIIGWDSTNGVLGYLTVGSGLSLTGGSLSSDIPISVLLPATATNTIDNANFQQSWSWNILNGTALSLSSTSTVSTSTNHKVLVVNTSGANANSGASTYGGYFTNTHTGTTSTNYGVYASASGGTTNWALYTDGDVRLNSGNFYLPTLSVVTSQDYLVGMVTGGSPTGRVGKVGIGTGLQLISGVLSTTAAAGTPSWQDTLTVSSTLTGSNTIAGGGFDFAWNNVDDYTIGATKLFLKVANFASASPGDVVTLVSTVTGEVNFQAPGAGSSGTVTNFSAGDLGGFFTTSEATTTTTPALSFAYVNAGPHTYWGNDTGGATTPAYISNAAFVRVNDTNVTMTLSGNPTTALLETMTATLGWTGTLGVARGGTNISSYAVGDIIYASGATTLAKLAIGTNGQLLRVNAGGTALEYFTHSFGSGTVTSFSSGDLSPLFTVGITNATTTPTQAFTLTNAAANTYFGNSNTSSGAPSYTAAGALTTVNDTNVLLTAGGNSATSLLRAASITASWNGTLGVARGGTNIASYAVGDLIYASGATTLAKLPIGGPGQQLRVNAGATALEYFTAGAGITSLNGLTPASQTFATSTLGADFSISSSVSTHTFNLPDAGILSRGVTTAGSQTFGGLKTFNLGIIVNESAADSDFRVETQSNTHAIFSDASTSRVGIFTSTPLYPFHVTGNSGLIGNVGVGTAPASTSALLVGGSGYTTSGLFIIPSISSSVGSSPSIVTISGTIIEGTSGTHSSVSGMQINPVIVTAGAATVTDAATVIITGPTTASGAISSSLVVDAGASRFRGDIHYVNAPTYTSGGKDLVVRNQGSNRLELYDPDVVALTPSTSTSFTPVLADKGAYITITNASPIVFNVPTNASVAYPTGTTLTIEQGGAGQITITPAVGVTVNASDGALLSRGQYSVMTLVKKGTNTWTLSGDTTTPP